MKLFAKLLFPIVLLCSSTIFSGGNQPHNDSILNSEELLLTHESTDESTNEATTSQEDTSWRGFFSNLVGEENYKSAEGYMGNLSNEQKFMFSFAAAIFVFFMGKMFPQVNNTMQSGLALVSYTTAFKGLLDLFAPAPNKQPAFIPENGTLE